MGTFHAVWVPSRNHEKNKTVLSDHKHLIKLSGTVFGHLFIENLGTNFYISFGLIHLVRTQLLAPDTLIYVCVSGCENISFSENFAYVLNEWLLLRCREDAEFRIYCTRRDLFRTLSNIHDDIFCDRVMSLTQCIAFQRYLKILKKTVQLNKTIRCFLEKLIRNWYLKTKGKL